MNQPDSELITITVHLHTTLQRHTPDGRISEIQLTLAQGTTVEMAMDQLDIPLDEENLLLVLNGHLVVPSQPLAEHDQLHLIPAISGGAV